MPFEKVDTQIDFPGQERAILEFWQEIDAFEKLRAKNRGKPKWSFLDGPITANNPMGVHHAWGRTYKDVYQRYFAMTGHEERYQNGFDCQGLWVEVEVEKELKDEGVPMASKRDIENLVPGDRFASIDRFVQRCKQRVDKYAKQQTEQSIRLGYWMDWDRDEDWAKPPDQRRSYFTMSEENNYTIWTFLKKCHEKKLVYAAYDAMPWCPRCAVGLSQMEMHEGYRFVAHRAVFVRFPLLDNITRKRTGEFLLVWTTTPWTLTSNVAAAINPDLKYLKIRHRDEVYYLSKGAFTAQRLEEQFKRKEWVEGVPKLKTLEQIFKEKGGYEILDELQGAKMLDWAYEGPFDELLPLLEPFGFPNHLAQVVKEQNWSAPVSARDAHRVVPWGEVGETEGTGIVHIAPGCGKQDFELGKNLQKTAILTALRDNPEHLARLVREADAATPEAAVSAPLQLIINLDFRVGQIEHRVVTSEEVGPTKTAILTALGDNPEYLARLVREAGATTPGAAVSAPLPLIIKMDFRVVQIEHRVVTSEEVGQTESTGIVHIAPGWGKQDVEVGMNLQKTAIPTAPRENPEYLVRLVREADATTPEAAFSAALQWIINIDFRGVQIENPKGLPCVAPLDDLGCFLSGFGHLEGKSAIDPATTDWILNNLQQKGLLFAVERYPHSYPHCWRCKTELLFRLIDEWFISMSWRDEIKEVVKQATWLPESINGQARELDWLMNMGDWMISKKRYWGLALPIWVCERCGQFDVIGSREELETRAIAGWEKFDGHSPHRPWIDQVKLRCEKCQAEMSRIPDVGNPWLDAGIVPYSTMKYNSDRAYWEKWFPADFITEAFPGQFRNWFYAILAMSTMMENKCPFKVLLGHAMVRDEKGEEMHKAKGNSIPFEEAAEKMGADLCRWLYCRQNPAANINFGYGPADEVRSKFTLKLWNTYAFFVNYARLDGFDPSAKQVPVGDRPDIDRWILSDLQLLIRNGRESLENYNVMAFCLEAEKFVDDKLSNWYVRRNRRRFWKSEKGADKQAAYQTLYTVLTTLTKVLAPVMPFLAEAMHQNLAASGGGKSPGNTSVHLCDFPAVNEALIDEQLSADMEAFLRLVSLGSAARNTVKIKVRQPLAEIGVRPGSEAEVRAARRFADQICEELNVKKLTLHEANGTPLLGREVKANPKSLGPKFGPRLKDVQASITAADPADLVAKTEAGQPFDLSGAGGRFTLEPTDLFIQLKAPAGWAGVADRGTEVIIDTRITEELAREGMARDVVRHVQQLRKAAGLEMEDRIALVLQTESAALQQAIQTHKDYIANETLTVEWPASLDGDAAEANVKIDGQALVIRLRKIG